ncbi:hypothetical protein Goshw_006412, partial [Gossypium schwendimanii]|nr:hypothetical protein [Gossypium schwendimanii]
QVHSLEEFKRYNSSTPRYEKEGRCICFEYIQLSCSLKLWDMLMRQSLTCSTDLIRGLRQFQGFWQKHAGH